MGSDGRCFFGIRGGGGGGGAWGSGGIPRRRPERIAYRALPKCSQFDLSGVEGRCLLDRRR